LQLFVVVWAHEVGLAVEVLVAHRHRRRGLSSSGRFICEGSGAADSKTRPARVDAAGSGSHGKYQRRVRELTTPILGKELCHVGKGDVGGTKESSSDKPVEDQRALPVRGALYSEIC